MKYWCLVWVMAWKIVEYVAADFPVLLLTLASTKMCSQLSYISQLQRLSSSAQHFYFYSFDH